MGFGKQTRTGVSRGNAISTFATRFSLVSIRSKKQEQKSFPFSPAGPGPPGNPCMKEQCYHLCYIDQLSIFMSKTNFDSKLYTQLISMLYKVKGDNWIARDFYLAQSIE